MHRLTLFARRPIAGRVKTRLEPYVGRDGALELYLAFLRDQIRFLTSFGAGVEAELCADGAWDASLADPAGCRVTRQVGRDLGARLEAAFDRAFDEGAATAIVIATDSPTLPALHVRQAFERLDEGAVAVVAPATDGGYVLVGLSRPCAALFRDVAWGSDRVLSQTLRHARAAGIEPGVIEPWYDVDDAEGLTRLLTERRDPAFADRAPATARTLDRLDASRRIVV